MDIRKFFGGGGGAKKQPASALSAIKKETAQAGSPKKESKAKPRPEKVKPKERKNIVDIDMDSHSDGESPLPVSVMKTAQESSRSKRRARIASDSEDDIPKPKAKSSKVASPAVSTSPSPVKARKSKVRIESDEDRSPTKSPAEDDDDIVIQESSEDEFVEKKSKRKGLLPGQKKLTLAPKATTSSKSATAVDTGLKTVKPSDFFGGNSKSAEPRKNPTPRKEPTLNMADSKKETPAKTSVKTASKTPTKTSRKTKDNEFVESDDEQPVLKKQPAKELKNAKRKDNEFVESDDEPSVKKPAKQSKEEKVTKRKDLDNEFVESDGDFQPAKKSKHSPSSKENQPQKKATKSPAKSATPQKKAVIKPRAKSPPRQVAPRVDPNIVYELPWVDKYKPKTISQLVGQHGDKSPMNKLLAWLNDWSKHNLGEGRQVKKAKPAPWQSGGDGSAFRAALISGSPGVGKTTCAYMACESLGLKFVEMNASDVRNKKHLEAQVAQLTGCHQMEEYFGRSATNDHDDTRIHHVLIMDEVDGMSGNEDRAGVSELIQIIKETKIPIICICNDRSHPKIRSLAGYCHDLRFPKPRVEQIRARIMSIAAQEKLKINKDELDELIELSGHDVRQTIYNLQMRGAAVETKIEKKDCAINTFEAARKLLDTRSSLMEKQDMFFTDYGIMPLFVQENYLNMKNKNHSKQKTMSCLREAADLISLGDTVDRCIRSTGSWKLLNEQSMFSAALPSIAVDGHLSAQIQFPSWLGKNSSAGKRQRLMRQLAAHAHLKLSADTHSLVTDYVPVLRNALTQPLITRENDGIPDVVATMTEYDLLKDDAEAIGELAVWPGKIDAASKIPAKVKAALTRALNKEHRMLPYHLDDVAKGRKKAAAAEVEMDEDGNLVERVGEGEEPEEEEEEKAVTTTSTTSSRGRGGAARGGRGSTRGASTRGGRGKK